MAKHQARSAQRQLLRAIARILLLLACGFVVPSYAAEPARPAVLTAEPAAVIVWNREIVVMRGVYEQTLPATRAALSVQRLLAVPPEQGRYKVEAKAVTVEGYEGAYVLVNGNVVVPLMREDVNPQSGETFEQLTERTVRNIETWLALREEQQNPRLFVRHLVLVLVSTALFVVALFGAIRVADYWQVRRRAAASDTTRTILLAGVNFRPYLIALEIGIVRLLAWAVYLGLTYVWLTFALNEFPYTRSWGERLASFLANQLGGFGKAILGAIPDLFAILVIVMLARLVAAVVSGFFRTVERGGVHLSWLQPETAHVTRRIVVVVVWLFAIVMAYPYIPGSDSEAFKGLSVLIGLMVSLGSAGLVGQVMGGFVVVYNRALRVGEWVCIGEHEGRVTEIGMLSTRLLTRKNEEITIPNAVLIGSTTTNYSRRARDLGMMLSTTVTIGYDTPWRQVHAMLLEAARRTAGVAPKPAPRVMQGGLQDFYVRYDLIVPILSAEARYATLSELHAHVQDVFNEHGVQIMSPHFVAQPAQAVIVAKENWAPPPAAADAG